MKNKITPSADKNYLEKSLDIIIKFGLKVTKVKKKNFSNHYNLQSNVPASRNTLLLKKLRFCQGKVNLILTNNSK